jgi:hypothetical protein
MGSPLPESISRRWLQNNVPQNLSQMVTAQEHIPHFAHAALEGSKNSGQNKTKVSRNQGFG